MKKRKNELKLWAMDTEDDSKGHVYIINFFNGETHYTFHSQSEAFEWFVENMDANAEIWATNTAYDLQNFLNHQISTLRMSYVGSRFISAQFPGTQIFFRDTLNHWKISVEEMGKRIGLKKLKATNGFDDVVYCQRDTEITYRFVKQMRDNYHSFGARLKATIGSTALDFFQKNYSFRRNQNAFKNKELDFMRRGYYGGRTEIFFNKPVEGLIHYVDFNSLYPAMMKLHQYPTIKTNCAKFTKKPNFENEGICHVRVRTPMFLDIPYLPFRRDNGGLIFPLGNFEGFYTYFEIREAQKLGYKIERVFKAFEFRLGHCRPFEKFVSDLYSKRMDAKKKKDELLSDSYKLIMNNLYGKFGQGDEKEELIPYTKKTDLKSGDVILGDVVLRKTKGVYPPHSNMIWAAYVTAYARHALWKGLQHVKDNGGLLIYCDTDSIIYESSRPLFPENADLGGLKSEGLYSYAHFKLPKLYVLDDGKIKKYRAKGIPMRHAEEYFTKGRAKFKKPLKLRETLRRNLSPKRKIKLVTNYWLEVEKETRKVYDKRRVLKDGSTRPVVI